MTDLLDTLGFAVLVLAGAAVIFAAIALIGRTELKVYTVISVVVAATAVLFVIDWYECGITVA
jgi:hypothetical protein